MSDQDGGSSQSATGSKPSVDSSGLGSSVAGQSDSAQEFGELPTIPAIEQPDAVLVATSEDAELLMKIARRRARNRRRLVISTYSVLMFVCIASFALRQYEITIAVVAVIACTGWLRRRGVGPLVRSDGVIFAPDTQTLRIRFGPEAFELQRDDRRVHFPYRRFRALIVDPDSITLRTNNTDLLFQRNLFPDTTIDYLRARIAGRNDIPAPPPLPPFPPLVEPTATITPGPDTATRMAWGLARRRVLRLTNSNAAIAVLALLLIVAIAGTRGLIAGAVVAGAMVPAALAIRLILETIRFFRSRTEFAISAPVGEPLATRFGPDSVAIHTPTTYIHERYDRIIELYICRHVVLMRHHGRTAAYPRELFPDRAIAHMRAANPELR